MTDINIPLCENEITAVVEHYYAGDITISQPSEQTFAAFNDIEVICTHNLGRHVHPIVVDLDGNHILLYNVQTIDINTVACRFDVPFTGYIYI